MPTSQSHHVASGIGRASALLASGTIVSRILGFVKVIVFAQVIGQFGQGADAFTLANQLPNTVYVIGAGGVLTAVLVPQIVRSALHHDGGTAYINKLVTMGFLEHRQGQGTFVRSLDSQGENNPLSAILQGPEASLEDLLEVRMGLEGQAAILAAQRATPRPAVVRSSTV